MKRSLAYLYTACIFSLSNSTLAIASDCPIERARYELIGDRSFKAGFDIRPTASNPNGELTLFVESAKSQFTYWFRLNFGNGYTTLSMTPLRLSTIAPKVQQFNDIQNNPAQLNDFQPLFLTKNEKSPGLAGETAGV